MADNTPEPKDTPRPPSPPAKGMIPIRVPALNTQPMKKGGAGKIVVMLSSVAKPPPALTQPLSPAVPGPTAAPLPNPTGSAPTSKVPPPLPPKQVSPTVPPLFRPSSTTHVKLPPKTSVPRLTAAAGPVTNPPPVDRSEPSLLLAPGEKEIAVTKPLPPPLPLKRPEPARVEAKKPGAQHIPPIKLGSPSSSSPAELNAESLFAEEDQAEPETTPTGWKSLEPGELNPLPSNLQSMEVFARSQRILGKLNSTLPVPKPKDASSGPEVKPPLRPPPVKLTATTVPPVLPAATVPPLAEKPAEGSAPAEKLPPPVTLPDSSQTNLPPIVFTKPLEGPGAPPVPVLKAPGLIQPELGSPALGKSPPPLAAKPILPPASPSTQPARIENTGKKSAPIIVSSISPIKAVEIKPETAAPTPVLPKAAEPGGIEPPVPSSDKVATPPPVPVVEPPSQVVEATPAVAPPPTTVPKEEFAKIMEPAPTSLEKPGTSPPPLPRVETGAKAIEAKPASEPAPIDAPKTESPAMVEPPLTSPEKAATPPPLPTFEAVSQVVEAKPAVIIPPSTTPKAETPAFVEPPLTSPEKTPSAATPAATGAAPVPFELKSTVTPEPTFAPPLTPPGQIEETKPALKPPVLPSRLLAALGAAEVAAGASSIKEPETKESSTATFPAAPTSKAIEAPASTKPPQSVKQELPSKGPDKVPPPGGNPPVADLPASPSGSKAPLPPTRLGRLKKKRMMETIFFWAVLVPLTVAALFAGSLYFGQETRVEGQVIPPAGMILNNEVWIVTDFSSLAAGIAEDLAKERTPLQQEIQEHQEHVQRAQADVAAREERIRLINQDIQSSKDEIDALVKQSREATQQLWDGPGAQIDVEYQARFDQLKRAIADRAKSLKLNYQPDETYQSPEVWANAYRLALYSVPAGVDSVKEHQWLGDQMKQWRAFLKTLDDRKEQLRDKAAELKLEPAPKIADLNAKIDDLQHRIDVTAAEEVPLKAELQQALTDLVAAQAADAGLDDKYYKQLDALPAEAITKHIPLATNGRFTWLDDDVFAEGVRQHHYWIFACATRADGRQYWVLGQFTIEKNHKCALLLEPNSFISTKAILRPNLSPDEQAQ